MFGLKIDSKNQLEFFEINFSPAPYLNIDEDIAKLNDIYNQVPKPVCNHCGNCCGRKVGNPTVFSLEYINIHKYIHLTLENRIQLGIYASATFSWVKIQNLMTNQLHENQYPPLYICPCLDTNTNTCLVYPVRPLVCRNYGMDCWEKDMASDWRKADKPECPNVKISKENTVENWNLSIRKDLFERLQRLSAYYFSDEKNNTLFNQKHILYWFAVQTRER